MSYHISCDSCQAMGINGHATHETGCSGVMLYKRRGREYRRFRVWSLDVWGNKRDGFEVNDRSSLGYVMLPADLSDKATIRALKAKEWLNKRCHFKSFSIDGDDRMLNVDYQGCPIFTLEAE